MISTQFKAIFCFVIAVALVCAAFAQQAPNVTLKLREVSSYWVWLSVSNSLATNFLIETSHDLRNWESVLSVETPHSTAELFDRDAPDDPSKQRFYRAKVPGISVDDEQRAWAAQGLSHYRYRFTRVCFCRPTILSGTVTVLNGTVVSVSNASDGQVSQPIPDPDLAQYKSIEQLFGVIREAKEQQADIITVKYDSILRFPVRLTVDFLAGAADDEISYEASNVEPIN